MVAIQASPTTSSVSSSTAVYDASSTPQINTTAYPYANGNGTSTNLTSTSHNATAPLFPINPSVASPSGGGPPAPISKLGAGLGAALGFATVVILLVLWHIFKAHRQQQLIKEQMAYKARDNAPIDEEQQGSIRRQQQMAEHKPVDASLSSSRSSMASRCLAGKNKQKEAMVTTADLSAEFREEPSDETSWQEWNDMQQASVVGGQGRGNLPQRGRDRGRRGRRRQSRLGDSLWERRDGHERMSACSTETLDGKWISTIVTDTDRPKFSFEGVVQSEDSIESISEARAAFQTNEAGTRPQETEIEEQGENGGVLGKGEKARHVYEMEPY